jgi:hypothetical protein
MSKATREGRRDAETWMGENPRSEWADAIRPSVLGADEGLINALGAAEAARYLGVPRPYVNGELTSKAYAAFRSYAKAWEAAIRSALKGG